MLGRLRPSSENPPDLSVGSVNVGCYECPYKSYCEIFPLSMSCTDVIEEVNAVLERERREMERESKPQKEEQP